MTLPSLPAITGVGGSRARLRHLMCLIIGGALGGMCMATASAVRAASGIDLSCPGYQTSSLTPGVTLMPRQVSFTSQELLGPCTSSDPTLTSGSFTFSGVGTFSCTTVSAGRGTGLFRWNNGRTSQASFVSTVNLKPGGQSVIVARGDIVSGEFTHDAMTQTVALAAAAPQECLTDHGITSVAGPVTITFTGSS